MSSTQKSAPGGRGSCHSKPSSLMTDEDWDQALTRAEQQQQQQQQQRKPMVGSETDGERNMGEKEQDSLVTRMKSPARATLATTSPPMKGKEEENEDDKENDDKDAKDRHSTPSSPSEIRKLTKKNSADGTLSVREARQFAKELKEWINKDHSPFEDKDMDRSFS